MVDYIAELQAAILNLHGCTATHVETVPVTESFKAKLFGKAKSKCLRQPITQRQNEFTDGATSQAMTIKDGAM